MKINRLKPLLIIGSMLLLTACGGGGGGTVLPQKIADLELSTQGTTTAKLGTIDVTFPLPQDVAVSSISPTDAVGKRALLNWSVTPATGTSLAKLSLTLIDPDGFLAGVKFATVKLTLVTGRVPTVTDFTPVDLFIAKDLNGAPLPATDISLQFAVVNI